MAEPASSDRATGTCPLRRSRFLRVAYPVLLTLVFCWLVSEMHGQPSRGVDDAQITFSYSANLAAGKGLVYANNPERVEGVTSLLWALICSVPFALGLDEAGVLAIALALLCVTQLLALGIIRRMAAARGVPAWPFEFGFLLAVFSSPSYLTWMSISLMDTCLWGLLVVLMVRVVLFPPGSGLRSVLAASVPFLLAPLSRPEAMLVAPGFLLIALLGIAGRRRFLLWPLVALLASVAGVTLFRLGYFGYPFPNTFYAKVSPSVAYNLAKGFEYLVGFTLTTGPITAAAAFFLLWCGGDTIIRLVRRRRAGTTSHPGTAPWRLAALCAMVLLATPVLTGGDHFVGYRFFQPAYPVIVLAGLLFLAARLPEPVLAWLAEPKFARRRLVLAVLVAGVGYWAFAGAQQPSWLDAETSRNKVLLDQFRGAERSLETGRRLRVLFSGEPHYPPVGVTAAGGIARTYPGPIVDLMGLNSLAIAHNPGERRGFKNHAAFDKELFFRELKVEVLDVAPRRPGGAASFASLALKGLLSDARFVRDWRYGVLERTDGAGGFEAFYAVRLVDNLATSGRFRFRETWRWRDGWVAMESRDCLGGSGPDVGPVAQ